MEIIKFTSKGVSLTIAIKQGEVPRNVNISVFRKRSSETSVNSFQTTRQIPEYCGVFTTYKNCWAREISEEIKMTHFRLFGKNSLK
jgi:hypothetical protein